MQRKWPRPTYQEQEQQQHQQKQQGVFCVRRTAPGGWFPLSAALLLLLLLLDCCCGPMPPRSRHPDGSSDTLQDILRRSRRKRRRGISGKSFRDPKHVFTYKVVIAEAHFLSLSLSLVHSLCDSHSRPPPSSPTSCVSTVAACNSYFCDLQVRPSMKSVSPNHAVPFASNPQRTCFH